MLLLGPYQSERYMLPPGFMVTTRPKLLLMAMSRSMVHADGIGVDAHSPC